MAAEFDNFLSSYSPEVRSLAEGLRGLVLEVMPESIEQVDPPSKIVAYGCGRKYKDLVCAIAPYQKYVNLIFSKGMLLPDPTGLLEGTGKRARHVKITEMSQLAEPGLRNLILAGAAM